MTNHLRSDNENANDLIHETSPYLLQHAYNPVHWKPWNEKTLDLAKKANKPILVSIGYSACHWCHVMEHESFEDEEVADIMNAHFICVKVDREERPDVDQLYMNAAQLITGGGGWPLNCFAFPDGKPFYAGTYYQKDKWLQLLETIKREWEENRDKLKDYADKLLKGIKSTSNIERVNGFVSNKDAVMQLVDESVGIWAKSFDHVEGGGNRAPKFPLPNNYQFLSRYASSRKNIPLQNYVDLTLSKMARGGIYDQIGGGFARYSVDNKWKVPHFEKMLYDNAQLLELYSEAYEVSNNKEYLKVIKQTSDFLSAELLGPDDLFYSAYDADSEGVEGKYYVWTIDEIHMLFPNKSDLIKSYFGLNERGYWEADNFILCRTANAEILKAFDINETELESEVNKAIKVLYEARTNRTKPGLDDKCLTNWNALTVSGLCAAFQATSNQQYIEQAENTMSSILKYQLKENGSLFHSYKNGKSTINGFLEDYASVIQALLHLYAASYDADYAQKAKELTDYTLNHFYNDGSMMFQFTDHQASDLVAKQTDYFDNVIPSSNSIMTRNLLHLSQLFLDVKYRSIALEMIDLIAPRVTQYGSGFSNWMLAMLDAFGGHKEVVIVGEKALAFAKIINQKRKPNWTVVASVGGEDLPIVAGRLQAGKTLIYVCEDNACLEPVASIEAALDLLA
ncbi:MAG: thioredoxin domain-containing protein [Bacteroidetes bacterium]|jgi:uncharacterized protein YyaL (SSP411 family)|nr:thioredoxin domain-containing protein [Bacteroidota bacterium]